MFSFLRPAAAKPQLSMTDVVARVASGEMTLLDVREMSEARASGKAKRAVVIPLSLLPLKADPGKPDCQLDPAKPVAIYCASGARSGVAVRLLTKLGFTEAHNIGALRDWQAAGGEVVRA